MKVTSDGRSANLLPITASAIRPDYRKVHSSHFIRIGPGETYEKEIDVWAFVDIERLRDSRYYVQLLDTLLGFHDDDPLEEEPLKRSDVYRLARINFDVTTQVKLRSTPERIPEAPNAIRCPSDRRNVVDVARQGANNLARLTEERQDESENE